MMVVNHPIDIDHLDRKNANSINSLSQSNAKHPLEISSLADLKMCYLIRRAFKVHSVFYSLREQICGSGFFFFQLYIKKSLMNGKLELSLVFVGR